MIWLQLVLVGIATGAIYALAGMGLVLTYKATGIFNFAYGGIAMICAYIFWQMRSEWGWPTLIAAPIALLLVGPGIGVLLERVVFRPLARKGASTTQKLVATLGVFELCLGLGFKIWTGTTRTGARIVSGRSVKIMSGVNLGVDNLFVIAFTTVVCVAVWLMFRKTHLGTEIRAVVDRPELAELAGVDANRVRTISWAMGCGLAGATGILLASGHPLDPYHFTLLVLEVFAVAVVARLTSLPVAVAAGVFLLGVPQSVLTKVDLAQVPFTNHHFGGWIAEGLNSLKPNLSAVILIAALLIYRNLDEIGTAASNTTSGLVSRAIGSRRAQRSSWRLPVAFAAAAIAMPFLVSDITLPYAQITVGLAVTFTSIICVTGFSGQITLGQAAIAGFGAFVSARLAGGSLGLPVMITILLGGLAAMLLGLLAGFPALKRKGLFLGLTTLALALLVHSFVFQSYTLSGGAQGLRSTRPSLFGWSLDGPWAFYWFELVVAGLMLLLARNLRSGRLGRVLAAMRDSETAAKSVGIDLRAYKLFIFGASSFIAGIGGCLLAEQARVFNAVTSYDVFQSLLWFVAVIVAGVSSIWGAVLGAILFELLDKLINISGSSQLIIALGALFIGYLPGSSLVGLLSRTTGWLRTPRGLVRAFERARAESALDPAPASAAAGAAVADGLVASPFADRVLEGSST
ncbi:MAG: inner-rane translocator [Acidimicrobiales bacterium]|nr:inner-rane translocator [Acidimicrobiales bacterium]